MFKPFSQILTLAVCLLAMLCAPFQATAATHYVYKNPVAAAPCCEPAEKGTCCWEEWGKTVAIITGAIALGGLAGGVVANNNSGHHRKKCCECPPGTPGATGPTGPIGLRGPRGITGAIGAGFVFDPDCATLTFNFTLCETGTFVANQGFVVAPFVETPDGRTLSSINPEVDFTSSGNCGNWTIIEPTPVFGTYHLAYAVLAFVGGPASSVSLISQIDIIPSCSPSRDPSTVFADWQTYLNLPSDATGQDEIVYDYIFGIGIPI